MPDVHDVRTGPPFRLGSQEIIQLLGDPQLYYGCPVFLFIREQALAAVGQYHEAIAARDRGETCCDGKQDDRALVAAPLAAFVRTVVQLVELQHRPALEDLRRYISTKLDYQPERISLVVRQGDKITELEI